MDTTIERGIIIQIDGEGKLTYTPFGLTTLDLIGILEMTKQYAFHDLVAGEQKAQDDNALIATLKKLRGN